MNKDQAREILMLYRPGTNDATDPEMLEAMRLAEMDPELFQWFQEQQTVTAILRAKLKATPVPDGLKEQILSERPTRHHRIIRLPIPSRIGVPALAFALFLLLGLGAFIYFRSPGEQTLAYFRDRMVRIAIREYPRMDVQTSDLNRIRQFLASQQAHGDYVLPSGLQKATGTGCAILRPWHGKRVSMICFSSGKPTSNPNQSDLFLFIIDRTAVSKVPSADSPNFAQVNSAATVSWSDEKATYLLVADGDEEFLKRFY